MTDRRLLYVNAFLRAIATGLIGITLGLHLAAIHFSPSQIGYIVAAGLAGAGAASIAATVAADRHGRRRLLVEVALLGAAGAVIFASASDPFVLGAAAFVGMLNGMGRDRGAALIVEQAILPSTVTDAERTRAFAWYNVLQDAGHALGSLLAGLPSVLGSLPVASGPGSHRVSFTLYAALLLAVAAISARLTGSVEQGPRRPGRAVSPTTRRLLVRISTLFALDSLGGGFLATALLSYFFFERFGAGSGAIGALFFGARSLNAVSHLVAAWLARRIGLVNTMVFTHIPSSLLLVTVAFAPSFAVAAVLFLLREGLVEMDVPTRQSYVMAVVPPEDRTVASGVTHVVRTAGWAAAPSVAGVFMQRLSLLAPLIVGASLKIAYDILLYAAFRSLKPPEELSRSAPAAPTSRGEPAPRTSP
jgi:MFS family permease